MPTDNGDFGTVQDICDYRGLWNYDSEFLSLADESDTDKAASKNCNPHGTFIPTSYFRTWVHRVVPPQHPDQSATYIYIFDDKANFACFLYDETTGIGKFTPMNFEFTIPAGTYPIGDAQVELAEVSVSRAPTLFLSKYTVQNVPKEKKAGDYYIAIAGSQMEFPDQSIQFSKISGYFTWALAAGASGLDFRPAVAMAGRGRKVDPGQSFASLFFKVPILQVGSPFYGYDPRNMTVWSGDDNSWLATPGTGGASYASNLSEGFAGRLVFAFPEAGTGDYISAAGAADGHLPLGINLGTAKIEMEDSSTVVAKSLSDTVHSWGVTLGLNAGVEGMFSVGGSAAYDTRLETQKSSETRYTICRSIDIAWVSSLHPPSTALHDEFLDNILQLLATLLQLGKGKVNFANFIGNVNGTNPGFGSHYAHCITFGEVSFAETRFTLQSESIAREKKIDLKAEASADVEGLSGKSSAEIRDEWKTKHQIDFSTEDVKKYRIGAGGAVPIFFDLRPITELLSPVYFGFNPDHPILQFSPFIWYNLRDELDYFLLTEVGLNNQVSKKAAGFFDDLSPHRIHVSAASVKAVIPADKAMFGTYVGYSADLKVGISIQAIAMTDPDFVKYGESPVFAIGQSSSGNILLHAPYTTTGKLTYSVPQALALDLAVKQSYESKLALVVSGNFTVTQSESTEGDPIDETIANINLQKLVALSDAKDAGSGKGKTLDITYTAGNCTLTLTLLIQDGPLELAGP